VGARSYNKAGRTYTGRVIADLEKDVPPVPVVPVKKTPVAMIDGKPMKMPKGVKS